MPDALSLIHSDLAAILTLILVGSAGMLLGWYLCNSFNIRSLRKILQHAQAKRDGAREQLVNVSACAELAALAGEFNLLHATLAEARTDLAQSKNALQNKLKRTERLSYKIRHLEKRTHADGLTGLGNRSYFDTQLGFIFERARSGDRDLACLMIDIDRFKLVNDRWGHAKGDKLIVFAGELLRACTREGDICVRFGGDEFIALLPDCSFKDAQAVAERLRMHFARECKRLITDQGEDIPVQHLPSLSVGLASSRENRPQNGLELIKMADDALYRAKEAGRNCVVTR